MKCHPSPKENPGADTGPALFRSLEQCCWGHLRGTVSTSDGSRAWVSVHTRCGRWSAKANGLASSRPFGNEASQELADSSLILLG